MIIIHRHQGNQKIKSDFPPAFPHWRYSPLYWGISQNKPFPAKFWEKMPTMGEVAGQTRCAHAHEIKMKKIQILQEDAKSVTNFPLAVTLRQFSPKIAKIGFSPLILGQNKPNKNLRTARGKVTIPKMTTR